NKNDLPSARQKETNYKEKLFPKADGELFVSARTGENIQELKEALGELEAAGIPAEVLTKAL
ncbi:MAG: hypothetical protein II932_04935, partial [Treponema sp.]|nr:hypothetical protein [Treponema sp.]